MDGRRRGHPLDPAHDPHCGRPEAELEVEAAGAAKLAHGEAAKRTVAVPAGRSITTSVKLAAASVGEAKIRVRVKGGAHRDEVEHLVAIAPAGKLVVLGRSRYVTSATDFAVFEATATIRPEAGFDLRIEASAAATVEATLSARTLDASKAPSALANAVELFERVRRHAEKRGEAGGRTMERAAALRDLARGRDLAFGHGRSRDDKPTAHDLRLTRWSAPVDGAAGRRRRGGARRLRLPRVSRDGRLARRVRPRARRARALSSEPVTSNGFSWAELKAAKKRVHRLGLAMNYGIDAGGVAAALERGMNYLYWTGLRTGKALPVVQGALARDRERYVVAAQPGIGFFGWGVRRGAEAVLRKLKTDYVDVFQLGWVGVGSALTDGTIDALLRLREEGKIRALGVSIHDRPRAGRLAEDSPLDILMIRYNAAHPGAEREIFPHLEKRRPSIVAYTATSWRRLLKRPPGWDGPVMSAGDCYRFCLSSPHVDVVLTGPKSTAELEENLAALDKGPLTGEEAEWMRKFGAAVHG